MIRLNLEPGDATRYEIYISAVEGNRVLVEITNFGRKLQGIFRKDTLTHYEQIDHEIQNLGKYTAKVLAVVLNSLGILAQPVDIGNFDKTCPGVYNNLISLVSPEKLVSLDK